MTRSTLITLCLAAAAIPAGEAIAADPAPAGGTAGGIAVVRDMLGEQSAVRMANPAPGSFAPELGPLALDNVFGDIWTRPGLSRRDRSLVTLGILIALRAENELRFHFPIALKNGVTRAELEEVIYQSAGYAGFPAAASARKVASEVLPKP